MKESRCAEEQIAFALKQAETGTPVAEVIRWMGGEPQRLKRWIAAKGFSEQTFYRWKKVYGELGVGELRRGEAARRRPASGQAHPAGRARKKL